MKEIDRIKAPIAAEMDHFERKFRDAMKSKVALLDKITHYIVKRKGKQVRPMFVFLSAKTLGGFTESTYHAASLIELLHTATLVHDDVVDDAYERRGFFSLNALWKNKIAVLVGDYLLSRGLLLSVRHGEFRLLELVSDAVQQMSEGELLQIEKSRVLNLDEEIYFEIIRKKTATLIAACCACGAASVTQDPDKIEKFREFGEKVGIAFQIKDDLFDYGLGGKIGKPTGIDLKERKTTLPLIYALEHADRTNRSRIMNAIKSKHQDPREIKQVMEYVIQSGGIEYADRRMREIAAEALAILDGFSGNEASESLRALVNYTIDREK